jgi:hypothetical protein
MTASGVLGRAHPSTHAPLTWNGDYSAAYGKTGLTDDLYLPLERSHAIT